MTNKQILEEIKNISNNNDVRSKIKKLVEQITDRDLNFLDINKSYFMVHINGPTSCMAVLLAHEDKVIEIGFEKNRTFNYYSWNRQDANEFVANGLWKVLAEF